MIKKKKKWKDFSFNYHNIFWIKVWGGIGKIQKETWDFEKVLR